MSDFTPPRMEHVIIDEETQMQRYLADIAMEDILLAGGKRTERPGGLMAQYRRLAAEELAAEAANQVAEVCDASGIERVAGKEEESVTLPEGYEWAWRRTNGG